MVRVDEGILGRNVSLREVILDISREDSVSNTSLKARNARKAPLNDVVSKNITQVLENLLKDYESSQLPSHGKGK